jgi:hypothetical protein
MNKLMTVITALLLLTLTGCQSGCTSRYTGGTTKLPLPNDYQKAIGFGKSDATKYLMYETKDGALKVKEYSDVGMFEATYEFTR